MSSLKPITTIHIQKQFKDGTEVDAMKLLKKLEEDFTPLLLARGFTINRLSEMCCCGKSKIAKNASVLGYCMPAGDKKRSRGIYIRLRHAKSHEFYDYEGHLVETMAHEITHIMHGAHSAEFYAYLDVVMDDYDEMKRTGEVRGLDKFIYAGGGKALGSSSTSSTTTASRSSVAAAAEKRNSNSKLMGSGTASSRSNPSTAGLSKREIVAQAAERRFADMKWCGECEEEDDDEIEIIETKKKRVVEEVIDLTNDLSPPPQKSKKEQPKKEKKKDAQTVLTHTDLRKQDVKEKSLDERARSVAELGFNIYGNTQSSTRQSSHLT